MNPESDDARKEAAELLAKYVTDYYRDYMTITKEIQSLQMKKAEIVKKMDEFIENLSVLSGLPKERWEKSMLNVHFSLIGKSIGDAIELIIKSEGPQTQKALIDKMRAEGVKISAKAPYAVIKNAILRDSRKRFKLLDDGRVDLGKRKENKKPVPALLGRAMSEFEKRRKG